MPIRASIGALTGNTLGLGGYEDIIKSIARDTLGGAISLGTTVGLDALGLPPIATGFVSGFLESVAVGLTGGSSGGGGPGSSNGGAGLLSRIGDGIQRFGSGFINTVGNVVDFGKKVFGTVGQFTVEGFKKGIGAFASIFSRQTQESIYADETGLRAGSVVVDGNNWSYQNGDTRIVYNTATDTLTESFGVGGTARIEGLGQDERGNLFYNKLTYSTAFQDGTLTQVYDRGQLSSWGFNFSDKGSVNFTANGLNGFDSRGNLLNGTISSSDTGASYRIEDGFVKNIDINWSEGASSAVTPPANIEKPWFEKYALSNAADATDDWLDRTAEWIIGEAEGNVGWILNVNPPSTGKPLSGH